MATPRSQVAYARQLSMFPRVDAREHRYLTVERDVMFQKVAAENIKNLRVFKVLAMEVPTNPRPERF